MDPNFFVITDGLTSYREEKKTLERGNDFPFCLFFIMDERKGMTILS